MGDLILPRKYEDKSGKYPQHLNKPKLSYSQLTSWKDPQYKPDYIKQYFAGIILPSGIYAEYGSACGTLIEGIGTNDMSCHNEYKHLLSEEDRNILKNGIDYESNMKYEDLIVLDCGDFVIEGFTDRTIYHTPHQISIGDFKTGSIAKKKSFYASKDYMQTKLYSYAKEQEGCEIVDCGVFMLDRAGNNSPKSPIRLTGKIEYVPTPYDRKEVEGWLQTVKKTAKEISDSYKVYLKYFGNE